MSQTSTPSDPSSISSCTDSPSPPSPPILHQNTVDPSAKWLVQKFGGTSVGKFAVKIAHNIVSAYIDQHKVAIVCSARSGSTKALGTTTLLLRAASEALRRPQKPSPALETDTPASPFGDIASVPLSPRGESPRYRTMSSSSQSMSPGIPFSLGHFRQSSKPIPEFKVTIDLIRQEHLTAAGKSIRDLEIRRELEAEIEKDCNWAEIFLSAAQIIDEISPRSRDSIVGLGEILACKFMTAVLRDQGIDAEFVPLDDIITSLGDVDNYTDGTLDQTFYDRLSVVVGDRVRQCGPRVPVVTGFFGPVPGSLFRQVGRGYTDLLAAVLAAGLDAAELQIWKEVDGIFTADPRKVPTARLIPIISPDEAAELTYYGSEVIHPFSMEQAIRKQIPVRIKNVMNPQGGGTVIHPEPDVDSTSPVDESESSAERLESTLVTFQQLSFASEDNHFRKKAPTAVTIKDHIIVLNVNSNRKSVSHGFLAGIFSTLDRFGVVVDLISTSEVHISMAIEDGLAKRILDKLTKELKKSGTVSVHRDMAILSLVGRQMRNMVGIAGRMFTTLAQGNVNIEMISQGASEINISCVIEGRDALKALNVIHQTCLQIPPDAGPSRGGPWLF